MNGTTDTLLDSAVDQENGSRQPTADFGELRPRICLLGADYENSNLGIRALTTGVLTAVTAQFRHAEIKILDYGPDPRHYTFDLPDATVHTELVNIRFSKKVWLKNHIVRLIATSMLLAILPLRSLRRALMSDNPWLRTVWQSDYVFALNYGDSFSDLYGLRRFFYVSLPQVLAIALRKKLVQMPQTIGPFKSSLCRVIAKWILARSVLIYTRDEEAVARIRSLVPASHAARVRFCPDLGFAVPSKSFTRLDPPLDKVFSKRPVVGLNVSGLLWMGGYTQNNMFGLALDYKALVRKAIAYFIEDKGATVLLVPHLLWIGGEGDLPVCAELFRELQSRYPQRIFTLTPPYDEREIKDVIGQCDFFVGSRMHACIAALSQGVPAAAMAYSGKFIGVFRSVGMDGMVADLRSLSGDQALALLTTTFDSRETLRARLRRYVPAARERVFGLLNDTEYSDTIRLMH